MCCPVVEDCFINLVGNQEEIPTESQLSKAFERPAIVGGSRWIAGAVNDDRLGPYGDEPFQFMVINCIPILFTGWQENRRGVVQQGLVGIGDPIGDRNDDFVTSFKERFSKVVERMFGATGDQHLRFLVPEPLLRLQFVDNRLAQFINAR